MELRALELQRKQLAMEQITGAERRRFFGIEVDFDAKIHQVDLRIAELR